MQRGNALVQDNFLFALCAPHLHSCGEWSLSVNTVQACFMPGGSQRLYLVANVQQQAAGMLCIHCVAGCRCTKQHCVQLPLCRAPGTPTGGLNCGSGRQCMELCLLASCSIFVIGCDCCIWLSWARLPQAAVDGVQPVLCLACAPCCAWLDAKVTGEGIV
jgi:hypothetical protein